MLKIIHNNIIIDLCPQERYLKYLPYQKRFVEVKKYLANAVLGSDSNTIYHLDNTPYNFPEKIKTVQAYSIPSDEYEKLRSTVLIQNSQETINLKKEIDDLKSLIHQQNVLIQQFFEKLKD